MVQTHKGRNLHPKMLNCQMNGNIWCCPPKKLQFNDLISIVRIYLIHIRTEAVSWRDLLWLWLQLFQSIQIQQEILSASGQSLISRNSKKHTLPETNSSHPKMDGWTLEDYFLFWGPAYFSWGCWCFCFRGMYKQVVSLGHFPKPITAKRSSKGHFWIGTRYVVMPMVFARLQICIYP